MNDSAAPAAPSTAQIVIEILELLEARTDHEHGLSAAEISREILVSEKTVRAHLRTLTQLKPFGRTVGRLERKDLAHAQSADPRPGWYLEPLLDTAQMRLLADGVAFSRSDGDYLRELIEKVYAFAGRSGDLRALADLDTPKAYNTEFLNTIELLNDAIEHERTITFHYCDYGIDGGLVPRRDDAGAVKAYHADPYHLMYKNNKYYLICHLHQYEDLSYLHVERFRDMHVDGADGMLKRTLDSFSPVPGRPFDVIAHMNERPYPMDGPAVPITMRISGSLAPLYDWFEDAEVTETGGHVYEVRITANERATLWWALQYADDQDIEILAPQSLRDMLCDTGRRLADRYRRGPRS